ncbi:transcription antitermination factor NusB [Clostridium argentinense CDC 2741]|uniref:Transcription antitermination protein NusB n=1 Tax=Clostridium argentinense CDC 2741 TaxID=1418104 RepID=A0A0C1UHS1_9CLOT|nr:transcription antitermination factor NusB [Clostridium argentinense]ARC85232.1 N utilization substance protein B [Clostridium argentinense]KIE46915.1 transcription antitermination factor NusB [Clostridium argentinense CDC 2741]NFF39463.1 transcription antitermination factor NusB [Clostridium argentinense]NFP50990.1 transcription antitermination factor NusB [Clostridium argentinense]NFP73616.1 transcription antitermination factor NusB [Clostridium argentinense]
MNRKKSREIAMQLLFEMSINKESYTDIIESFKENTDIKLDDVDFGYIIRILKTVNENIILIDETIEKNLVKWSLNRLSKMNLAILRIAICEILFEDDIPEKVSVNEGIELAKKYGEDNASSFINGVLNSIIKGK